MEWITTTQILEDLRDSKDSIAWEKLCKCFRPLIVNFAIKLGLSNTEAEDAAQETLLTFFKSYQQGKYDKEKGHLRHWLFGIAKNVILNLRGNQPLEKLVADQTTNTSFWDLIQDDHSLQTTWQDCWQQMLLEKCLQLVKREFDSKVFEAFSLYALSGIAAEEVAKQLSISTNAVYISKSRILSRLRELERQFE
jgi:RNA polymerase sigma-70 factor (ECF subfamily)